MSYDEPGVISSDAVGVRTLTPEDLDWVVQIDRQHSGTRRHEYYRVKLSEVNEDTGLRISLAAEVEGQPAGFVMGRLYYGEFGIPEPTAVLDSIGVDKAHKGRHVGQALMRQLYMNLNALGIQKLQTEVEWTQFELLGFLKRSGFEPAPRLCLEADVETGRVLADQ